MARLTLRCYALIFLVVGLLFVAREAAVLGLISRAGAWKGLPPLFPAGPSLWLGLTGSLMTVIAWLSWRLAQDARQPAAWEALLLSKAVSSALFMAFAVRTGNALFIAAAAVDGLILAHLGRVRRLCEGGPDLAPRLAAPSAPFYEVWFARTSSSRAGRALWVRYTVTRRAGSVEAACWAVFFDAASGRTLSRRWEGAAALDAGGWLFRMGDSGIAPGILEGSGEGVSWSLRWRPGPCPPAAVVGPWLRVLGLSRSGYDDVAPAAEFRGAAVLDGETWDFSDSRGCVGHVWGERCGPGWWWAHAVFPEQGPAATVFEILSAPGPAGLRATSAILWRGGRLHRATGPLRLLLNRSSRHGDEWRFRARLGPWAVEGRCSLGVAAALEYEGPDGRKLACRNSKVSSMRLRISDGRSVEDLATDAAALEFVEPAV